MEAPKLIVTERDCETPMAGMCSLCRAIFPAIKENGAEANKRLLESCFRDHIKAEHSDQPPPWESAA